MKKLKTDRFNKFFFEFISIFFAVTFAFLLNNWNENRKDKITENKILLEIYNGLERDSLDLVGDDDYYKISFRSIHYLNKIIDGHTEKNDSLTLFYFMFSRDVLIVQNRSGYESLKSRGLETITNDSLRKQIIDLYEVRYELQRKFNEEYDENKFRQFYFDKINDAIAPHFVYDAANNIKDIELPLKLTNGDRNVLKSYLWKLQISKKERYQSNQSLKNNIGKLRAAIHHQLED